MNDNNMHVTLSALEAHLNNIRSKLPPAMRACIPDSTSSLLRGTILLMAALNLLLFLSSLLTIGVRFLGFSILLISAVSCMHISCIALVLGSHVAGTIGSFSSGGRLSQILASTSDRYGTDAYMHGVIFGATTMMAMIMQVLSSVTGGVSSCASNLAAYHTHGGHNITAGYANNMHTQSMFDTYATCGASGPVGFVSFLTGILAWLDFVLMVVLYVKRGDISSGLGLGSSNQYDEIGADNAGFEGDFPGARTMTV